MKKITLQKKYIDEIIIQRWWICDEAPLTRLFRHITHCWDPISQFYINSHRLGFDSMHIFVLYQPTHFFIASQCLSVSVGAICWGKRVVRNSESEMAAKRRSPWGTSTVITPRIPLCRPWTLTSESTPDNHLQPHTSQNKDCRGFSDAHSWHTAQELTVNEHFIQECFI